MTTLPELKITDEVEGTGKAAVKGALLTVQYSGFLEDGTKFDSSYDHGRPFQFVIGAGRVIKGWDQGLMGMKEGGRRHIFVPAHLGYGERVRPKNTGPLQFNFSHRNAGSSPPRVAYGK